MIITKVEDFVWESTALWNRWGYYFNVETFQVLPSVDVYKAKDFGSKNWVRCNYLIIQANGEREEDITPCSNSLCRGQKVLIIFVSEGKLFQYNLREKTLVEIREEKEIPQEVPEFVKAFDFSSFSEYERIFEEEYGYISRFEEIIYYLERNMVLPIDF